MTATLIVPGGMPRALEFLATVAPTQAVVGASSLLSDPARVHYPSWAHLPAFDSPGFAESLSRLLDDRGVGRIFCPHPVLHAVLSAWLHRRRPDVALIGPPPHRAEAAPYRWALAEADELWAADGAAIGDGAQGEPVSALEFAALICQAQKIPGECNAVKLWALARIAALLPQGDVVEIGSLYGRSAYALAWLARRYRVGDVLCVDPWDADAAPQADSPAVIDAASRARDFAVIREGFLMTAVGAQCANLNYIRAASAEAIDAYRGGRVRTPEFGETAYRGRIACLHIDGNHDHAAVTRDIADWTPFLVPGAWLVIDDYRWYGGDGPRRAADAFLADRGEAVACAFCAGGALFVGLCA